MIVSRRVVGSLLLGQGFRPGTVAVFPAVNSHNADKQDPKVNV